MTIIQLKYDWLCFLVLRLSNTFFHKTEWVFPELNREGWLSRQKRAEGRSNWKQTRDWSFQSYLPCKAGQGDRTLEETVPSGRLPEVSSRITAAEGICLACQLKLVPLRKSSCYLLILISQRWNKRLSFILVAQHLSMKCVSLVFRVKHGSLAWNTGLLEMGLSAFKSCISLVGSCLFLPHTLKPWWR